MRAAWLIASLLLVDVAPIEAQVTAPPSAPRTVPPPARPSQPPAVRPPPVPAPAAGAPVRDAVRARDVPAAAAGLTPLAIDYHEDAPRRSMIFLGIGFQAWAMQPCVAKEQLDRIAAGVRQQLAATGWFDTFQVPGLEGLSREAVIGAIQKEVAAHDQEVAKARSEARGENYDFKYRGTIITGDAIRQVHDTTYGYEVSLGEPVIRTVQTPQGERHIATIPVTVTFLKIDAFGVDGRPVPPGQAARPVPAGQVKFSLIGAGAGDPCVAVGNAANGGFVISDQIEAIPAFRMRAQIDEMLDRGRSVTMRPGRHENVQIGDEYDIYEVRQDGSKQVIGRATVTKVGPGLVAAGDGASRADVDRTALRVTQLDGGYNPDNLRGAHLEKRPP